MNTIETVRGWRPSRDVDAHPGGGLSHYIGSPEEIRQYREHRLAETMEDVRRRAVECGEPITEVERDARPATIASQVRDLLATEPDRWWRTGEIAAALGRRIEPMWSTLARLKLAGHVEYMPPPRCSRRGQPGVWRLKRQERG